MPQGMLNPYGAGAVRFDSSPYTNFVLQQRAKDAAKQEALDKYFGEVSAQLSGKNLLDPDARALAKMKEDWMRYNIANKDKIKDPSKDNGKAWGEHQRLLYQMRDLIDEGTNKAKKQLELAKIRRANREGQIFTQKATEAIDQNATTPIYEQIVDANGNAVWDRSLAYQPIDDKVLEYNPKRLGTAELQKIERGFLPPNATSNREIKSEKIKTDENDPTVDIYKVTKAFGDEQLGGIFRAASDAYKNDESLRFTLKQGDKLLDYNRDDLTPKEKAELDKEIEKYNNFGKKYLGKDFEIQDPSDIYGLKKMEQAIAAGVTEEKRIPNKTAASKMQEEKQRRLANEAFQRQLKKLAMYPPNRGKKEEQDFGKGWIDAADMALQSGDNTSIRDVMLLSQNSDPKVTDVNVEDRVSPFASDKSKPSKVVTIYKKEVKADKDGILKEVIKPFQYVIDPNDKDGVKNVLGQIAGETKIITPKEQKTNILKRVGKFFGIGNEKKEEKPTEKKSGFSFKTKKASGTDF